MSDVEKILAQKSWQGWFEDFARRYEERLQAETPSQAKNRRKATLRALAQMASKPLRRSKQGLPLNQARERTKAREARLRATLRHE